MTPITTTRTLLPGGDVDGEWQIVAEGERGVWRWMAGWSPMARTWFWDRVKAGSIYACQGRTPGYPNDRFTLYAKLASHLVMRRAA
jgi:hypothetical protein